MNYIRRSSRNRGEQVVFVRGKNENLDVQSVHSSVLSHACHAAAEACLSVLFVPVTSRSGWMTLGALEARRHRWKVCFVSHSCFYFTISPPGLSCSKFMNEALSPMRRSWASDRTNGADHLSLQPAAASFCHHKKKNTENGKEKKKHVTNVPCWNCVIYDYLNQKSSHHLRPAGASNRLHIKDGSRF